MKRTKIITILLAIILALSACGRKEAYGPLKARDAGAPYSDWDKSATGSVKYLDGSTLLVSIFLQDKNASWTSKDYELVNHNLQIADDFLVNEGKEYGKEVNLIYNTDSSSDLSYTYYFNQAFDGSTGSSENHVADDMVGEIHDFITTDIPSGELMEKYNVNSIGYMIFIDGSSDSASAYVHYYNMEHLNYYEEMCFINLRWSAGNNVFPDTYAHEILHLFGARDLYYAQNDKGVTREFINYVAKEYPEDIMLGNAARGVSWEDKITLEISDITAYFIGWKGYIYALEDYPTISVRQTASFHVIEEMAKSDDSYTLSDRLINQYIFIGKVADVVILICCLIYLFTHFLGRTGRKNNKSAMIMSPHTEDIFYNYTYENYDSSQKEN